MTKLISRPTRPVQVCSRSRWRIVPTSSGARIIEPIFPLEEVAITPLDVGAIIRLAEIELGLVDNVNTTHKKSATPKRWQPGEGFGNTR